MKIIKEKEKTSIVLEDKDCVEVMTLNGNHTKIKIKCLGGTLFMEEENGKIVEEKNEEEKAIQAMKEYLKKNKNQ